MKPIYVIEHLNKNGEAKDYILVSEKRNWIPDKIYSLFILY